MQSNKNADISGDIAQFSEHLRTCIDSRQTLLAANGPAAALRLFNGFYEGLPNLTIDIYAQTLVFSNYSRTPESLRPWLDTALNVCQSLALADSALVKTRAANSDAERRGVFAWGNHLPAWIEEYQTRYALDLRLHQDEGFYLDTRGLRQWLKNNLAGKSVLNCFAYTGSLGIAALAGGASSVLQTDREARYLELAEESQRLNHLIGMQTLVSDFFRAVSKLKRDGRLFDCVILDPSIYSESSAGKVDLTRNWLGLVNKVRPLVAHEGLLIVINNGLFIPGSSVMDQLATLAGSGYIRFEKRIDVPQDFIGFEKTIRSQPPADPSPFNHPTKISVMRVTRKDKRRA